jgi:hemerythrin-like domain-containing protein
MAARKSKQNSKAKPASAAHRAPRRKAPQATARATASVASAKSPRQPAAGAAGGASLIKALTAEHRHIASVMRLFGEQLDAIEAGELVDTHVVYEIMEYMVSWPDRFHHPREDLIYGRVAELDATAADNVDSLQRDHDAMAKAGQEVLHNIQLWRDGEGSGAELVRSGRAYIEHMYEHMNSEEKLVFPQIEQILTAEDWRELARDDQLRPVSDPLFGRQVQREFRNLARKLRSRLRQGVERGTLMEWLGVEALMESLDVVSMAYESARGSARTHAKMAWDEGLELFRESPVTAPWRCTGNNARLGLRLLQEVADISREALGDIARVKREWKDRVRLLDR